MQLRINPHGILSICLLLLIGFCAFVRQWAVNWYYLGGAVIVYAIAIIILSLAHEQDQNRRLILELNLHKSLEMAKLTHHYDEYCITFYAITNEVLKLNKMQEQSFQTLRQLIGFHLFFTFALVSMFFKLDMMATLSAIFIFISCLVGGMAVPYLLLKRQAELIEEAVFER